MWRLRFIRLLSVLPPICLASMASRSWRLGGSQPRRWEGFVLLGLGLKFGVAVPRWWWRRVLQQSLPASAHLSCDVEKLVGVVLEDFFLLWRSSDCQGASLTVILPSSSLRLMWSRWVTFCPQPTTLVVRSAQGGARAAARR
jgi:hypothetical protein